MSVTLINGEQLDRISVNDRGFQYGDGLYETLRIVNSDACHWERHMQRLRRGCQRLGLTCPDMVILESEAKRISQGIKRGVLKIVLTRGIGKRGYVIPDDVTVTRVLSASPAPEYPPTHRTHGIEVTVCRTPLGINPVLAGVKHLNRLEQVLARAEWRDPQISEGLMSDIEGHIIEGTMSNIFCIQQGKLLTPDISRCGVAGITRERILELATQHAYDIEIKNHQLSDLKKADELFICNSLIGIWPVRKLGEKSWQPGPLTRELMHGLEQQDA